MLFRQRFVSFFLAVTIAIVLIGPQQSQAIAIRERSVTKSGTSAALVVRGHLKPRQDPDDDTGDEGSNDEDGSSSGSNDNGEDDGNDVDGGDTDNDDNDGESSTGESPLVYHLLIMRC
jgi:hypothetical protein